MVGLGIGLQRWGKLAVGGLGIAIALFVVPLASATVQWVETNDELDILGQHLHAYVGAYLSDAGSQCKFSQYSHSKGDTSTSSPYTSVLETWHNTGNTQAYSRTWLYVNGQPTEHNAYAEIWTNPTPPCAF